MSFAQISCFLRNTYVQQAAAPNSNNRRICRLYQLINILPKKCLRPFQRAATSGNARCNALQLVAARLNAFKRNATQRAAVVEIDLKTSKVCHQRTRFFIIGAGQQLTAPVETIKFVPVTHYDVSVTSRLATAIFR